MQPLLAGKELATMLKKDDIQYVEDLGLIKQLPNLSYEISNDIYKEIIPRELTFTIQSGMSIQPQWYMKEDGTIDMCKLLKSFQEFFREHSEAWIQQFQYNEAGPQLLLQAYLQRIVNGGGRIDREYGPGHRRTDLFVQWKYAGGLQKVVIELKILYKSLAKTIEAGIEQTLNYMDKSSAESGHLIIFDRTQEKAWDNKIFHQQQNVKNKTIHIWGC